MFSILKAEDISIQCFLMEIVENEVKTKPV